MKQKSKNLPVVNLTLAFKPSSTLLKRMATQLKKSFGNHFALETKVDPSILGGLTISFQGRYQNLSLRKKWETAIHEKVPNLS